MIPLPEAEDYQIRIRDKIRKEKASWTQSLDLTKFDVIVRNQSLDHLPKRRVIYHVIRHLCDSGVDPEEIRDYVVRQNDARG